MRTLDECVAEIRHFIEASDSPTFCGGTIIPKQLASETLTWIEKLVSIIDDMGAVLPCCTNCEGKTQYGERTELCLFGINSLDQIVYCGSKGIEAWSELAEKARAYDELMKEGDRNGFST